MAPTPTRTSTGEKPPTSEIGYSALQPPVSLLNWGDFANGILEDEVPDLAWPNSVPVFHRMRTDAQVDSLMKAVTLPIRRRRWVIDPNGAKDSTVEMIAADFGLPIKGTDQPPPRGRRRFNHDDHLRHALLALVYGHMYFEQVGIIDANLDWRLRKLAPRMPQSIHQVRIAADGGLDSIVQWNNNYMAGGTNRQRNPMGGLIGTPIPVKWLAAYVWDREGANWHGRSLLRPIYRNYLLKDRILRIDAMRHEKYGLGIPVGKAPKGANDKVIQAMGDIASGARSNPDAGYGIPAGAGVEVVGPARGSLPDTIASIKYHDEAMARDFLAMFMQLGTTESGSRALGITFADFFSQQVDAISQWYANITNEFVIEDMVDWNVGPDEQVPLMSWEDKKTDPIPVTDLVQLINEGIIVVDEDLQSWARDNWDLPAPGGNPVEKPAAPAPPATITALPVAASAIRDRARAIGATRVASAAQTHGATVTRRAPSTPEVDAGTDFEAIQAEWDDGLTALQESWGEVQTEQIRVLAESVATAVALGNPEALANLSAPVMGTEVIGDHMMAVAEAAMSGARAEAASQGVDIELVNSADIESSIRGRAAAVAVVMSRALAQAAASQALGRYGVENLTPDEVAAGVRDHLESLSGAFVTDIFGGALTQAQNTGRRTVMSQRPGKIYASEFLDKNTCEVCSASDGREFDTIEAAEKVYPAGGNAECLGGMRCRGILVKVYDEGTPAIAETA